MPSLDDLGDNAGRSAGSVNLPVQQLVEEDRILRQRYSDCASQGHLKIDGENNYCNHCYRHVVYNAPNVEAIMRERAKLPILQQPLDAPVMMQRRREEIEEQKQADYFEGLRKLREETNS